MITVAPEVRHEDLDDAGQALIREARRRARRRHVAIAAAVTVLAGIAGGLGLGLSSSGPQGVALASASNGPLAGAFAFANHAGTIDVAVLRTTTSTTTKVYVSQPFTSSYSTREIEAFGRDGDVSLTSAVRDVEGGRYHEVLTSHELYVEVPGDGIVVGGRLVDWISSPIAKPANRSDVSFALLAAPTMPEVTSDSVEIGPGIVDGVGVVGYRSNIDIMKFVQAFPSTADLTSALDAKLTVWIDKRGEAVATDLNYTQHDGGVLNRIALVNRYTYSPAVLHVTIPSPALTYQAANATQASSLVQDAIQSCPQVSCPGKTKPPSVPAPR